MENFEQNARQSQTTIKKCPACGSTMNFNVEKQNLACDHCGYIQMIEASGGVPSRNLTTEIMEELPQWTDTSVYRCNGCGSKEVLDKKNLTRICPFCGSTNIVGTQELPGLKPDGLIPFMITPEQGAEHFEKWLKRRWFAPKKCKKSAKAENLKAIYNPVWTFDAVTFSTYSGRLGRTETRTYTSNGQTHTQSTIHWFDVRGQIGTDYKDYLVQSGSKITQDTLQNIQPFNPENYRPYKQEFLSGYVAEHYSRDLKSGFDVFTNFVKNDLKYKIMSRHNADHCSSLTINTNYSNKKFKYMLLPVYISCFYYNGKLYNFYMNASNGKVTGKYPKSFFKVFLTVLGIGVIVGAIVWAFMSGWFNGY